MKRMKNIIVLFLAVILTACGATAKTWQDHYDLGMRYLSEGNYEEAIVAFNAAIEIDPKQPDVYIGLTEAYLYVGDYEKAMETLKTGYETTGDARLEKENFDFSEWIYDDIITPEQLTIGGVPFYEMSIYDAEMAYPDEDARSNDSFYTDENCISYAPFIEVDENHFMSGRLSFMQYTDSDVLTEVSYYYDEEWASRQWQPEFSNITMGISMEDALKKIGVSDFGIVLIQNMLENETDFYFEGNPCLHVGNNANFYEIIFDWHDDSKDVWMRMFFENGVLKRVDLLN